MEYTMLVNNSDVLSKVGTLKAGLEFLKRYSIHSSRLLDPSS